MSKVGSKIRLAAPHRNPIGKMFRPYPYCGRSSGRKKFFKHCEWKNDLSEQPLQHKDRVDLNEIVDRCRIRNNDHAM